MKTEDKSDFSRGYDEGWSSHKTAMEGTMSDIRYTLKRLAIRAYDKEDKKNINHCLDLLEGKK
jgi:hypothetical protein